ncbi:TY-Chap domain-containing protein [Nocardia inohanensis]|uniref:TY-Chap domain-containing protein n=1 Tax=Nocardia inohanensis TaxID=209246 RepID=UPI000AEE9424|nr:hypothetical protein [Nocardia inohanensis]
MGIGGWLGRDRSDALWETVAMEAWREFPINLAWEMFALPAGGSVELSARGARFVVFDRPGQSLRCILPANANYPGRHRFPQHWVPELQRGGWGMDQDGGWQRWLPWPARYEDFEYVAGLVAAVLQDASGLPTPLELAAEGRLHETELDTGLLAPNGFTEDEMGSAAPKTLLDHIQTVRTAFEDRLELQRTLHEGRVAVGADYLAERPELEILTGGLADWPVRERTADFIVSGGPGHLLLVDVHLDFEGTGRLPETNYPIDGRIVQRGSRSHVMQVIAADPDLGDAVRGRPDLGVLEQLHIEYLLLVMDPDDRVHVHRYDLDQFQDPDIAYQAYRMDAHRYPVLQPPDRPDLDRIPHWRTANAPTAPIAVLATDTGEGYAMADLTAEALANPMLYPSAVASLALLQYDWELSDHFGLHVANCSGYDFSAEKILDAQALRHAHDALESNRLWIAVPRRTCLLAVPYELDARQTLIFQHLVQLTYDDDSYGNAPLTPGAYLVEDGRIVDFVADVQLLG